MLGTMLHIGEPTNAAVVKKVRVVGEPFQVERVLRQRSPLAFTTLVTGNPAKEIAIPSPRPPLYSVCPPIILYWSPDLANSTWAARHRYVEVWHDGLSLMTRRPRTRWRAT